MGVTPAFSGQPHQPEQLFDPAVPPLPAGEPEPHVAAGVQVGEKGTVLGHVPHPPRLRREVGATIFDHVLPEGHGAGVGILEAGQDAQQRRLAASRRPEHGRKRTFRHLEVEPVENDPSAEGLSQAGDDNARHVPNADRRPEPQKPRHEVPRRSSRGR